MGLELDDMFEKDEYWEFIVSMGDDVDRQAWLYDSKAKFAFFQGMKVGERNLIDRIKFLEKALGEKDKRISETVKELEDCKKDFNNYLDMKMNDDLDKFYRK